MNNLFKWIIIWFLFVFLIFFINIYQIYIKNTDQQNISQSERIEKIENRIENLIRVNGLEVAQ